MADRFIYAAEKTFQLGNIRSGPRTDLFGINSQRENELVVITDSNKKLNSPT